MKIQPLALALSALLLTACESKQTRTGLSPEEDPALVTLPAPDLSGITENGKEVLDLYRSVADTPDAGKKARLLRQAAVITIKPAVREYLLTLSEDLQRGQEKRSQKAWLELSGSQMDLLVTGPVTRVLLHNPERTAQLRRMAARVPELQASLPCDEDILAFLPEENADFISCDVLYCGGGESSALAVLDGHTLLFDNIIREQYNHAVFPAGLLMLEGADCAHLDASAFYWNLAFREMAGILGVQETLEGKPVAQALGKEAATLEAAKAAALGACLCLQEVEARRVNALITREDVLATFVVDMVRQARLGPDDVCGKASLILYNYLAGQGAFTRKPSGKYALDYGKTAGALEKLGGHLLQMQANGNPEAAAAFVGQYAQLPPDLKADIENLERGNVPVDIHLKYE